MPYSPKNTVVVPTEGKKVQTTFFEVVGTTHLYALHIMQLSSIAFYPPLIQLPNPLKLPNEYQMSTNTLKSHTDTFSSIPGT